MWMNLNLITRDNLRDPIPKRMATSMTMRTKSSKVQTVVMFRARKTVLSLKRQSLREVRIKMATQRKELHPKLSR
jgi:hypothetical protein